MLGIGVDNPLNGSLVYPPHAVGIGNHDRAKQVSSVPDQWVPVISPLPFRLCVPAQTG